MNISLDHECFQWNFATGEHTFSVKFHFEYDFEGNFGWVNDKTGEFNIWNVSKGDIEYNIRTAWVKLSLREPFCGPIQPPPSKVILKIRQMEARRKKCLV